MKGGKSSTTNKANSDNTTFDNRMAADGEAVVTRAGGNVLINSTSGEAVELGKEYARAAENMLAKAAAANERVADRAIRQASANLDSSMRFGEEAVYSVTDANRRSLDFAGSALDEVGELSRFSINSNAATLDDALAFSGGQTETAFGFASGALQSVSSALSETLSRSQSESAQLSEKLIKIGIPALALVFIAQAVRN